MHSRIPARRIAASRPFKAAGGCRPATFYGNPDLSDVRANVNLVSGMVEHRAGNVTIRNHTLVELRSLLPEFRAGRATANKEQVALTTYNNATERTERLNQTDVTSVLHRPDASHAAGRR